MTSISISWILANHQMISLTLLIASFFYQRCIFQPSRITAWSHCYSNWKFYSLILIQHFTISGNIVYGLSDHLANLIILHNLHSLPSNIKVYKKDYSNVNHLTLISELQSIDWHSIFTSDPDPYDKLCSVHSTLHFLI